MTVSGKVTAATTAPAAATVVTNTLVSHLFHGAAPADVVGLIQATLTAAATFGAGWLARCGMVHRLEADVAKAEPIVEAAAPVVEAVLPATARQDVVEAVKAVEGATH